MYYRLPFINLIGSFYLLVSHSLVYCTSLVKKLSGVRIPLPAQHGVNSVMVARMSVKHLDRARIPLTHKIKNFNKF